METMIVQTYSLSTGRRRALMTAASPNFQPPPGCGMLVFTDQQYAQFGQQLVQGLSADPIQDFVTAQTGLVLAGDRYVKIDPKTNAIVEVVYGDLVGCGDAWPGFNLVRHDTADSRWAYNAGVFTAPNESAIVKNQGV